MDASTYVYQEINWWVFNIITIRRASIKQIARTDKIITVK